MNLNIAAPRADCSFTKSRPEFVLIKNDDDDKIATYKLARAVYAETRASSLLAVESLCAMIKNLSIKSGRELSDIATDETVFESLSKKSARHADLLIDSKSRAFQMCLRSVRRMMSGQLPDMVRCATRFHRSENSPDWAAAVGYVAEVDGLLFYL